jgi:hypothetical protein
VCIERERERERERESERASERERERYLEGGAFIAVELISFVQRLDA